MLPPPGKRRVAAAAASEMGTDSMKRGVPPPTDRVAEEGAGGGYRGLPLRRQPEHEVRKGVQRCCPSCCSRFPVLSLNEACAHDAPVALGLALAQSRATRLALKSVEKSRVKGITSIPNLQM